MLDQFDKPMKLVYELSEELNFNLCICEQEIKVFTI